jgi:hypothetical protein
MFFVKKKIFMINQVFFFLFAGDDELSLAKETNNVLFPTKHAGRRRFQSQQTDCWS